MGKTISIGYWLENTEMQLKRILKLKLNQNQIKSTFVKPYRAKFLFSYLSGTIRKSQSRNKIFLCFEKLLN